MSEDFMQRLFPKLAAINTKFGTPYHIYDELGIRETLSELKAVFRFRALEFKEFYAVKALPKPAIMDLIKSEECGFDCSSILELRLARAAGACLEDIMFTSNNTSQEEFEEALAYGGCIMNLDGIEYIEKLRSAGPFPELICFRLHPGVSQVKGTKEDIRSMADPDSKYGVPIERIVDAYRLARDAGAKRFGLHTMVCSNDRDYTHMVATYGKLLEVAAQLKKELGIELEFINGGGGIGIPYRPGDESFNLPNLVDFCAQAIGEFNAVHGYSPRLFMESGRFVTGPHGVLVNRVINVFQKYRDFIGVQVAMPALMRVGMYETAYHHCTLLNGAGSPIPHGDREMVEVAVVGSICEGIDRLAKKILLPKPREGDLIVTHDTGAHGSAMGFNYNGRCRPQELLLESSGSVRRICKAETYEDLMMRHYGLHGPEHTLQF
jgi:diaminopimelate decarboxylase